MSQTTFDFSAKGICEAMKIPLSAKFPGHAEAGKFPVGTLSFLMSEKNRMGFTSRILSNGDKAPDAKLSFPTRKPRNTAVLEGDHTSCSDANCTEVTEEEVSVQLSDWKGDCLKLNKRKVKQLCKVGTDIGAYATEQLNIKMQDIAEELNLEMVTQLNANLGYNIPLAAAAARPIDILSATSGTVIAKGWTQLQREYRRNLLPGMPCIIGSGNGEDLALLADVACCNDEGVDINGMLSGLRANYFRDYDVETVTGDANNAFVMAPGFTQLVTYTGNMDAGDGDGVTEFRKISHPSIPNLEFELKIVHNCENISMHLGLWYKLCQFPASTYFEVGHPMNPAGVGVNGTLLYTMNAI